MSRRIVWATDKRDQWLGARRTTERVAKRRGEAVILCSACGMRPATMLDNYFPYHWEYNRCEECGHA